MARLRPFLLVAWAVSSVAACDLDASDLASFLDHPFGDLSAEVTTLDDAELEVVMTELMLRFRSYVALREHVSFAALAPDACMSEVRSGASFFSFVADVGCTFGGRFSPTGGAIALRQEQVASSPVVMVVEVDYRGVVVGELAVDGVERIEETSGDNGASVRTLDLVQDGVALDYTFRAGLLDGEIPVFDYELPAPGGTALARISNPTTPGALVTVFLTGLDGVLECEVRDSAWSPGEVARGTCDNGAVFGLPR